jgi:hypothetical protein
VHHDSHGIVTATSGGIAAYEDGTYTLHEGPGWKDPQITCVARDSTGRVWAGSRGGILYGIEDNLSDPEQYNELTRAGAPRITSLVFYDSYILVGHAQGLSLFDREKDVFIATADNFGSDDEGNTIEGSVQQVFIRNNVLFALVGNRLVYFENPAQRIATLAFSDQTQWQYLPLDDGTNENSRLFFSHVDHLFPLTPPATAQGDYFYSVEETNLYKMVTRTDTVDTLDISDIDEASHSSLRRVAAGIEPVISHGKFYYSAVGTKLLKMTTRVDTLDTLAFAGRNFDTLLSVSALRGDTLLLGTHRGSILAVDAASMELLYTAGIRGFQNDDYFRAHHGRDGATWFLPRLLKYQDEWNNPRSPNTIIRYQNGRYNYFGNATEQFGILGQSDTLQAITEDSAGAIFVGSPSDHVKRYKNGEWSRLVLDNSIPVEDAPRVVLDDNRHGWMKVDGLTVDAHNNVWGTYWRNPNISEPLPYAWVYNYDTENYRYIGFDYDMPREISAYYIAAGAHNTVAVFLNDDNGSYTLFDGSAVFDESVDSDDDFTLFEGELRARVYGAVSAGEVLVAATAEGLTAIAHPPGGSHRVYRSEESVPVTALAAGKTTEKRTHRRTDIWTGVQGEGVHLYILKEFFDDNNRLDSVALVPDESFSPINSLDGLRTLSPHDIAYDAEKNRLWVVSSNGVSRVEVYRETEPLDEHSSSTIEVYPNPFRRGRHDEVVIAGISRNSYVDIYTESGRLVTRLTQYNSSLVDKTEAGIFQYRWRPPSGIAPGVYLIIAKDDRDDKENTAISKLLILPR